MQWLFLFFKAFPGKAIRFGWISGGLDPQVEPGLTPWWGL
jgi:hypothetical protein